jgi:hypothetical protein
MVPEDRSRRFRERVVIVALSLIVGTGIFLFFLMVTGGLLLAVLGALGAMAVVGSVHYAFWGRELAHQVQRRDDRPDILSQEASERRGSSPP